MLCFYSSPISNNYQDYHMRTELESKLQDAIQSFQNGNFDHAIFVLENLLQVDSLNLPALHVLGLIKISKFQYQDAVSLLRRAALINPNDFSIQYNLARALMDSGSYNESLVHHEKAVELSPNNPEAWLNYGTTLSTLGRLDDALIKFDNSLHINPNYANALLIKGFTLNALKRWDESLLFFDKCLQLNSKFSDAWLGKGTALISLNRPNDALICFNQVLILKPSDRDALLNKGVILHDLKRFDEALAHYNKAQVLLPNFYEVLLNKAIVLQALKRFDEALAHYDIALDINPNYALCHLNKAFLLMELKDYVSAISHYVQAFKFNVNTTLAFGDFLLCKMTISAWDGIKDDISFLIGEINRNKNITQPFPLLALTDNALIHKKAACLYSQNKYPSNHILGPISKNNNKKIRVGYFSPDFRYHPVSLLISEFLELHDREKFEIFGFSLYEASTGDDFKINIQHKFDHFFSVQSFSDIDIALLSRSLKIDICVDLAGHTLNAKTSIFSYRAAPIQVNWLGYAGTLGAEYFDYIIADPITIPESHKKFYTEKIVHLPNTFIVDDSKRISSNRQFTRQECGLPENCFIFCCFNNSYKFNSDTLDSFSRILLAVENSILWLSENSFDFRANILHEFEKRSIVPNRIFFASKIEPMGDYLSRISLCDLFLDTLPYNAHTTAVDCLKSTVPLLTLIGESFPSRVAASLLNSVCLPELITYTRHEYESLAIEIALNPKILIGLKDKLSQNLLSTPLFDTPLFTKHLEFAYSEMFNRFQLDLDPDHIVIS